MTINSPSHSFDVLAPYYDRALKILLFPFGGEARLRKRIAHFLKCENLMRGSRILEVGCGTGSNLKGIDENCPGCFELFGLDSSLPMLREASKKKYKSTTRFLCGDASRICFGDKSFEAVLAVLTLHEIAEEKRKEVVSELYRVLKGDGCILLLDFAYPHSLIGKALFVLLRAIEKREALEFARKGPDFLFTPFGLEKKKEEELFQGILKIYLYRKVISSII